MEREYLLLIGALKTFDDFTESNVKCEFFYNFKSPEFSQLISKYHIDEVAGKGTEIEKAVNLLKWCSENVLHNGGTKDVEFVPKTSLDILNYSFKKGREYGVYCRLQSIVFTECCLALGMKSRILHCLPFSPYDFDTHVVSMVYINSLEKWIMLDAGNNRYFMNEDNIPLSPLEIRCKLANNDSLKCNVEDNNYKHYMAKNMFYFKTLYKCYDNNVQKR